MTYRIKQEVGIDFDPWLNRWYSMPVFKVQERFLFVWWFDRLSFVHLEEAESYLQALKAMDIGKK